ncbi:hypothetical protein J2X19_000133 [Rhodoferax ferrireducens]|uniref:Uncharacterized protein n=1 Tax=Rhodoferax ferrireducens TaxID=192843 RepID=A0ABU2C2B6_9BURK|nr:hypothetical protein [Rhodoferax ferrireducens]MDR7375475.1 hypothetical protein [Rhodoferax ferrireducens]
MDPDRKALPDGREVLRTALHKWGTKNCFVEFDLYTTQFGPIINDEVEKRLFGVIDDQGAKAVRALLAGDHTEMHETFQDFFEHMTSREALHELPECRYLRA